MKNFDSITPTSIANTFLGTGLEYQFKLWLEHNSIHNEFVDSQLNPKIESILLFLLIFVLPYSTISLLRVMDELSVSLEQIIEIVENSHGRIVLDSNLVLSITGQVLFNHDEWYLNDRHQQLLFVLRKGHWLTKEFLAQELKLHKRYVQDLINELKLKGFPIESSSQNGVRLVLPDTHEEYPNYRLFQHLKRNSNQWQTLKMMMIAFPNYSRRVIHNCMQKLKEIPDVEFHPKKGYRHISVQKQHSKNTFLQLESSHKENKDGEFILYKVEENDNFFIRILQLIIISQPNTLLSYRFLRETLSKQIAKEITDNDFSRLFSKVLEKLRKTKHSIIMLKKIGIIWLTDSSLLSAVETLNKLSYRQRLIIIHELLILPINKNIMIIKVNSGRFRRKKLKEFFFNLQRSHFNASTRNHESFSTIPDSYPSIIIYELINGLKKANISFKRVRNSQYSNQNRETEIHIDLIGDLIMIRKMLRTSVSI